MIIGDRSQLAFEVDPVEPSWNRRSPGDRGPWARLAVWVKQRNLTRAQEESTDSVIHSVAVPLAPLASWLTESARAIAFEESPALARYGVEPHDVLERWSSADAPAGHSPDDWDDARYEWYRRHFWLAGADGVLLPDIALARADGDLVVSWRQPHFPGPRRLLFLEPPGVEVVPWDVAWNALRDFVRWVANGNGKWCLA